MLRTLLFTALLIAPSFGWAQHPAEPVDNHAIHAPTLKVELLSGEGNTIPLPIKNGYRNAEGIPNQAYSVRLTNPTQERVLVVLSVNAINPLTGKRAYIAQPGIVIDPGKTRTVAHIQTKHHNSPLLFTPPKANTPGIITVGVFNEKMDYPHWLPWSARLKQAVGGDIRFDPATKTTHWIPPSGAPFRKKSKEPEQRIYLRY